MDIFSGENEDGSASYRHFRAAMADAAATLVSIESPCSGPSLMFQDFAAAVADTALRDRSVHPSERTRALPDAVREAAKN